MLMNCRSWSCVSITSMPFPAKNANLDNTEFNPNANILIISRSPIAGDFHIPVTPRGSYPGNHWRHHLCCRLQIDKHAKSLVQSIQ